MEDSALKEVAEEVKEEEGGGNWWRDPASIATVRGFALLSGIAEQCDGGGCTTVPLSLQPAKFPKELYHKAVSIQMAINTVVDAMSMDDEVLSSAFEK